MTSPATQFAGGKPLWSGATAHQPAAQPIAAAKAPVKAAPPKPRPAAKPAQANTAGNARGLGKDIDVASLKVVSAPLPPDRVAPPGKYDGIFSKLTMFHAVECKPHEVGALSNSMRDWFSKRKIEARPRGAVVKHETTGEMVGRVWMVPKDHGKKAKSKKA